MKSRIIAGILLSLLVVASLQVAMAQTNSVNVRLNWTVPTVHTDNSPITGSLTYSVYQGAKGATKTKAASGAVGTSTQLSSIAPGTCFQVSAVEGSIESSLSSEVCLPMPPNAPSNFTVTIVVTVTTP